MTNEEMERAIEFLLNSQAKFEVRLEQTIEQVNRNSTQLGQLTERVDSISTQVESLTSQLGTVIETQDEFMQVVLKHITAQGEINASVRDTLHLLTTTVERHLNESHHGKP
jgi:prefoldin subunit 5